MNLVSIIIPFKNPGKYLKPCLESIRNQSYQNIEVLMIDDHSSYDDAEVARMAQIKDKRFQLYRSNGLGIINALQTGLDMAKGEFISRMDADDLMTKDKIELMRSALLKSNQKSVCTALVSYFASEKSIQEIFETALIEDVVGDFVKLNRNGANLKGLCPFHNEKTPSFIVSPSKNIYK